ncbi:MAG: NAD(+)/NADH kinase, partial [Planctomycetota bacterium]
MGEKVASLHRVLISAISRRPEISSMLPALEKEFRARSIEALTRPADAGASPGLDAIDLVLVLGGDGYMMGVIRSLGYPTIPFYGVNYGRVGFL